MQSGCITLTPAEPSWALGLAFLHITWLAGGGIQGPCLHRCTGTGAEACWLVLLQAVNACALLGLHSATRLHVGKQVPTALADSACHAGQRGPRENLCGPGFVMELGCVEDG